MLTTFFITTKFFFIFKGLEAYHIAREKRIPLPLHYKLVYSAGVKEDDDFKAILKPF